MDPRSLQILDRMGIDVWRLRSPSPESGMVSGSKPESLNSVPVGLADSQVSDPDRNAALISIADDIEQCTRCSLSQTRNRVVPGEGCARADWMFVGEAPGSEEDRQGQPFVGAAGQLLNAMIEALGMQRSEVFIANVIKCRPPANRDPLPEEVSSCSGFLRLQLEIVRPRVIVALGKISAQMLLGGEESMARMRQKIYTYGEQKIPLVATYHPAYLLRTPQDKGKVWQDLLLAKSVIRAD